MESLFYKKGAEFQYISNKLLDMALDIPFPINIDDLSKGFVVLKDYFHTQKTIINGVDTQGIYPRKLYFNTTEEDRNLAFITLGKFMICYRKPFVSCFIAVTNHKTVQKNDTFSPLNIVFDVPQYPSINNTSNYFRIKFCEELFKDVYQYQLGELPKPTLTTNILLFPFASFCGYIIQP